MLTVVLDTQILLRGASSVTSSVTAKIYAPWNDGRFTLLVSEPILNEIEGVLSRPEVQRDKFLECAAAGGADYIVSADADLLSLGEVEGIPIVDAPAFWLTLMGEAVP